MYVKSTVQITRQTVLASKSVLVSFLDLLLTEQCNECSDIYKILLIVIV